LDGPAGDALQVLDARMEQGFAKLQRHIDRLQDAIDREAVRAVGSQLPEAIRRIDGLAEQCRELESKETELEVRLDMTRTCMEGQEQQLQMLATRAWAGATFQQCSLGDGRHNAALRESGGDAAAGAAGAIAGKVDMHMQTISQICRKLQS